MYKWENDGGMDIVDLGVIILREEGLTTRSHVMGTNKCRHPPQNSKCIQKNFDIKTILPTTKYEQKDKHNEEKKLYASCFFA